MITVRSEYSQRKNEYSLYKSFITQTNIKSNIELILKSSMYLIAYNTIESTVHSLLSEINEAIKQENIPYARLNDQIKKTIQQYHLVGKQNFACDDVKAVFISISNNQPIIIDTEIIIKKLKLFSGDLDHRKIQEVFKNYGVTGIIGRHSVDMLKIKNTRNRLAHGEISYSDCCRNELVSETIVSVENSQKYLDTLISSVDIYINKKEYLS
jgi:hypothetical protein